MDINTTTPENSDTQLPEMKTLAECTNRLVLDGYVDNYKVDDSGLRSLTTNKVYNADEVSVVNFFRYEGQSDPEDNSILYAIEANDGSKGALIDAYGPYADVKVTAFMKQVDEIKKKTNKTPDDRC